MLREGKFEEVDVTLLLDDQVIGNGTMRRGPRISLPALVTANLSLSRGLEILSLNNACKYNRSGLFSVSCVQ